MWISKDLFFLSLLSEPITAKCVACHLLGLPFINEENRVSMIHDMSIDVTKFNQFLVKQCTQDKLDKIRNSPFYSDNAVPIQIIALGGDIWHGNACTHLVAFSNVYRYNYSALPTNSQFTERGVKESGYVTLGRRLEKNRSALAIARAKIIPDAMVAGKKVVDRGDGKKRLVQGKLRTKMLINEAIRHQSLINKMQAEDKHFFVAKEIIHKDLTMDERQFKKQRIDQKVNLYKDKESSQGRSTRRIAMQTRYELTPLLNGKIQYAKLLRDHNIEQIRRECDSRNLQYNETTNWRNLIKLIKQNEGDNKYFTPRTDYCLFKWNETHFTTTDL